MACAVEAQESPKRVPRVPTSPTLSEYLASRNKRHAIYHRPDVSKDDFMSLSEEEWDVSDTEADDEDKTLTVICGGRDLLSTRAPTASRESMDTSQATNDSLSQMVSLPFSFYRHVYYTLL